MPPTKGCSYSWSLFAILTCVTSIPHTLSFNGHDHFIVCHVYITPCLPHVAYIKKISRTIFISL